MFRIGLMGLGAIGEQVAAAIASGVLPDVQIVSALVRKPRTEKHDFLVTNDPDAYFKVEVDAYVEGAGHSAVQAHAESYIGLVECGVGLVPGWGGSKELLTRWATLPGMPKGPMPPVAKAFETVAMAKVGKSAHECRELGFLRPTEIGRAHV